MRDLFGGKIELYHVLHDLHFQSHELESNRMGIEHLESVKDFIRKGMFPEATIISHRELHSEHLAVPSYIKAAEIAIERNADFHLWIEDDALVLDRECHNWNSQLKDADVGLYRDNGHHQMINTAFFLSSRGFDERMLDIFKHYKADGKDYFATSMGSQTEHFFWRASKKQVVLNNTYAERHHPPNGKTIPELKKWLRLIIPEIQEEHLSYLHLDFGE